MTTRLLLAAVALLAALLYLWGLGDAGLVGDEFTTARVSSGSVGEILRMTFVDVIDPAYGRNRPAHHLLVHLCQQVFEDVEFASRLPAALAGIGAVLAIFALGRSLHGPREGLLTALLLATAQGFVWSSREARAYSPFVLFTILALWGAIRAARGDGRRWWVLLGASCAAGYYFHPVATLPACAILGAVILSQLPGLGRWSGARVDRRGLLVALGVGTLLMAPALWCIGRLVWAPEVEVPVEVTSAAEGASATSPLDSHAPTSTFLDDRGREPISFFARDFNVGRRTAEFLGPGDLWGFGVVGLLALLGWVVTLRRERFAGWTLGLLFALPLGFLVTVATGHGFGARYLIFLIPALALLDARGVTWLVDRFAGGGARASTVAAVLGLALAGWNAPSWGRDDTGPERDWPAAAALIEELTTGDTLIVVGTTGRAYLMTDHMGREQVTFYLGEPGRFTYRSLGALSGATWDEVRGALSPTTQVVAVVIHGASTESLDILHRHALEAHDRTGLSVLRPEDRSASSLEQLGIVLAALGDLDPREIDETVLSLRAVDALVGALESGACPRFGSLVRRLEDLTGEEGPQLNDPAWVYLDERLRRAVQLVAACPDVPAEPLEELLTSILPSIGGAYFDLANEAWRNREPRQAAAQLTRALECGVVPESQTREIIEACRSAGMKNEANALERALASSLESLEERD